MLKTFKSILELKPGDCIKWPFLSIDEQEVFRVEKVTKTNLKFKSMENSLGAIVPLGRLINYPKIALFELGKIVHAPMFLVKGD